MPQSNRPKATRPDADRRIRQAEAMARKLRLLFLLQQPGPWTLAKLGKELANQLGFKSISTQTIMRDLRVLNLAGITVQYSRREKSYVLDKGKYEVWQRCGTRQLIDPKKLATQHE